MALELARVVLTVGAARSTLDCARSRSGPFPPPPAGPRAGVCWAGRPTGASASSWGCRMRERDAVRIVPRNPITVALQEASTPFAYGVVANISEGGACIWTNARLEPGRNVALRLSFPRGSQPIDAEGLVVWGRAERRGRGRRRPLRPAVVGPDGRSKRAPREDDLGLGLSPDCSRGPAGLPREQSVFVASPPRAAPPPPWSLRFGKTPLSFRRPCRWPRSDHSLGRRRGLANDPDPRSPRRSGCRPGPRWPGAGSRGW